MIFGDEHLCLEENLGSTASSHRPPLHCLNKMLSRVSSSSLGFFSWENLQEEGEWKKYNSCQGSWTYVTSDSYAPIIYCYILCFPQPWLAPLLVQMLYLEDWPKSSSFEFYKLLNLGYLCGNVCVGTFVWQWHHKLRIFVWRRHIPLKDLFLWLAIGWLLETELLECSVSWECSASFGLEPSCTSGLEDLF